MPRLSHVLACCRSSLSASTITGSSGGGNASCELSPDWEKPQDTGPWLSIQVPVRELCTWYMPSLQAIEGRSEGRISNGPWYQPRWLFLLQTVFASHSRQRTKEKAKYKKEDPKSPRRSCMELIFIFLLSVNRKLQPLPTCVQLLFDKKLSTQEKKTKTRESQTKDST